MVKKILIIDDNHHLISYLEKKLSEAGHEVVTEANGMAAVHRLADYNPDIIFIDYFLPTLNGDKLCRIIRKMDQLKNTYLVVMSAAAKELQLEPSKMFANALIAKGTFKETADHFFSAIADAENSCSEKQEHGIIGIESVQPRRMTVELLEKYCHLQTMLDSISEGIVEIYRGQIVYANPAAVTILGKTQDQLLAAYPPDLFDESERSKVKSLMGSEYNSSTIIDWKGPIQPERKILSLKKLPLQGDPDTIILLLTDITEQVRTEEALQDYQNHLEVLVEERTADLKQAHEKLQQVQKMEAIGILVSEIAHDLNNILTGIVAYPDLLLLEIPVDSPLRKIVLSLQESGKKAAAVVQDLLTMARRGVATHEVVNLNSIVSEYLNSPEFEKLKSFHSKVDLKTDFEEDLLNILGSPVHLSKTVMNLVSNAAESMPNGGNILISTESRYVDRAIKTISGEEEVREGDYVMLRISDDGVGISSKDMERIFDPFYTKKMMGRSGTGLGMTVVWGTVKDHQGYIEVQSVVGKGTAFILYFPVTRQELIKKRSLIPIEEYKGKGESILIVDDVKEQRELAITMLSRLGYQVAAVSSGEEAIVYIKNNKADLVVLDMIMDPGIDGLETYKRILEISPKQKAVIVSGFSETERVRQAQELGAGAYIRKPYVLEKMGLAIRKELDQ